MAINASKKPCNHYYCDRNVGCPKGCGGCSGNHCTGKSGSSVSGSSRGYRRMSGDGDSYTNIFSEKNYWIGVAAGVIGLLAFQKYFKK